MSQVRLGENDTVLTPKRIKNFNLLIFKRKMAVSQGFEPREGY